MAAKRGRPRKEDADRLTPTEERLLGYIASECFTKDEGVVLTQADLAHKMDCSRKTIDRAVHRLREEGMIEVGVCRLETGGISANVYRLAWDPAKTRLEQSGPNEKDE